MEDGFVSVNQDPRAVVGVAAVAGVAVVVDEDMVVDMEVVAMVVVGMKADLVVIVMEEVEVVTAMTDINLVMVDDIERVSKYFFFCSYFICVWMCQRKFIQLNFLCVLCVMYMSWIINKFLYFHMKHKNCVFQTEIVCLKSILLY